MGMGGQPSYVVKAVAGASGLEGGEIPGVRGDTDVR